MTSGTVRMAWLASARRRHAALLPARKVQLRGDRESGTPHKAARKGE